jgi:hypothetical protein
MYYNYPLVEEAYEAKNQYFFGTEMFVAPITSKSDPILKSGSVKVYFPDGNWYDIFTNLRYKGETILKVYRDQTEMPVFAKEGAIIPLDANPSLTKARELPETIEWLVYPGQSNEFELIEDVAKKRVKTKFTLDYQTKKITIKTTGNREILPTNRKHKIRLNATNPVSIDPINISKIDIEPFNSQNNSQSFLVCGKDDLPIEIHIKGFADIQSQDIKDELFSRLYKAELEITLKDYLWGIIQKGMPDLQFISIINELENIELSKSLFELMYVKMS